MRTYLSLIAATVIIAGPATADINVAFREGAPKDRFVIENTSACATPALTLTIDLVGSAGKLVFDTDPNGAGVEVFQPFLIESGNDFVAEKPEVNDGATSAVLALTSLPSGGTIVASTDLDDTIGARQITVAGSELAGATVSVNGQAVTFGNAPSLAVPFSC